MKTAADIMSEHGQNLLKTGHGEPLAILTKEDVERIMLDAMRYGMKQAARMCGEAGDSRTGAGRELTDTEMHEASGCYGCQDMLNRAAKTAQLP